MESVRSAMARSSYGFGRWEASYWFLGPEQGKGPTETAENDLRVEAWERLGGAELLDCQAFHEAIGEKRWHVQAKLQRTWKQLILLLLAFEQKPTDSESVRAYQRDRWGCSDGDVCAIELSGIAARSLAVPGDRTHFLRERIELIRRRLYERRPAFLVMYGAGQRESWEEVAGRALHEGEPVMVEATAMLWTKHPVAHGLGNEYWIEMGERLRRQVSDQIVG